MTHQSIDQGRKPTKRAGAPDAHGQAALLLAESIIHGLLGKGILRADEAISIVTTATEVKEELVADCGEPAAIGTHSLALLSRIAASLELERT